MKPPRVNQVVGTVKEPRERGPQHRGPKGPHGPVVELREVLPRQAQPEAKERVVDLGEPPEVHVVGL